MHKCDVKPRSLHTPKIMPKLVLGMAMTYENSCGVEIRIVLSAHDQTANRLCSLQKQC